MADPVPSADAAALNARLVDGLVRQGVIRSPRIEAAFRAVPRHLFLPGVPLDEVYRDEAIPTKRRDGVPISSSSQPAAMATMLEQLGVEPGYRVLEIGAGTGYNAALLAHLDGPAGEVVTVDLDEDIVVAARAHLAAAGFGPDRVRVVLGDGGEGFAERAPYDRIELTVGAWDIAPAWSDQLAPGGLLLLPIWLRGAQKTVAFGRPTDGSGALLESVSVTDCAFMRLRGAFAGPEAFLALDETGTVTLGLDDRNLIAPAAARALLDAPGPAAPTGVAIRPRDLWQGLALWLGLREPGFCGLHVDGDAAATMGAGLFAMGAGHRWTVGLLDPTAPACCLLVAGDRAQDGPERAEDHLIALAIRPHGDATVLRDRLAAHVRAWDAAGRPGSDGMRIRVSSLAGAAAPGADEIVLAKRWTRLVVSFGASSPDR